MRTRILVAVLFPLLFCAKGSWAQYLVRDINPGAGHASPSSFAVMGENVYFRANDGTRGVELWKSDGTAAGTVLVKDINPGSASSLPTQFVFFANTLFFPANEGMSGHELWHSLPPYVPGTTSLVLDINPGSPCSSAQV